MTILSPAGRIARRPFTPHVTGFAMRLSSQHLLSFLLVVAAAPAARAVEAKPTAANNVRAFCAAKTAELAKEPLRKASANAYQAAFVGDLCGYYEGAAKKTLAGVNLASDVTFHGPIAGELAGRDTFDKGALELFDATTKVEIKRLDVDMASAIAIVEYTLANGKAVTFAEAWTRGAGLKGQLTRLEVFFDPRALLPADAK